MNKLDTVRNRIVHAALVKQYKEIGSQEVITKAHQDWLDLRAKDLIVTWVDENDEPTEIVEAKEVKELTEKKVAKKVTKRKSRAKKATAKKKS